MLKIGLTGGIGSGKSTVANYFASLNIPIIDSDAISRELTSIGRKAYHEITQHFGAQILAEDGNINRRALRNIIFANQIERSWLEKLLHPLIYAEILHRIQNIDMEKPTGAGIPYCIIVAPLLLETGGKNLVDRILVVNATPAARQLRAATRDHTTPAAIQNVGATQLADAERLKQADDIIDNNGSLDALKAQVVKLHLFYLHLRASSESR